MDSWIGRMDEWINKCMHGWIIDGQMCVCIDRRIDEWNKECMDGRMAEGNNVCMDGWMGEWMNKCVDG